MTLRLLIAEDDPSIAQVVAFGAQMTWPRCKVAVVTEGTDALRRFAADRPDLVVLDVEIPCEPFPRNRHWTGDAGRRKR
jgi:DNA-binding response OmpR family regulator